MTRLPNSGRFSVRALLLAGVLAASAPAPGWTFGLFSKTGNKAPSAAVVNSARTSEIAVLIREALDEQRYVDAGTLLDQAAINGIQSPELTTLTGELYLARGRFEDAMGQFRKAAVDPGQKGATLQGEGIALSMLGRTDPAFAALKAATDQDKTLWRAWNGLGREYDLRRDWAEARTAYDHALIAPGVRTAVVLNNRGYSLLLQNKISEASADFIAALTKDPGLAAARTNLRIALAWQGSYARAAVTGAGDDRAAVLNNVGLAAALRGDYDQAEKYLNEAMSAKGQYYDRASENLQLARSLAERKEISSTPPVRVVH